MTASLEADQAGSIWPNRVHWWEKKDFLIIIVFIAGRTGCG